VKLRTVIWTIARTFLFAHTINAFANQIDPAIEACIKNNAPKSTVVESIRLTSEGWMYEGEEVLSAKIYWQKNSDEKTNLLAVFDEPDDIIGSRLLFLEKKTGNDIYLYMPALFKVRRITSDNISSSMYGMDFSYEDFQWMYNILSTAISEQRSDAKINGELMYVFAVTPQERKGSKYETVLSYFDKKTCVIRQVEFFEQGNTLRKVLSVEPTQIKMVDGLLIPHKFLMRDVKEESETVLTVISVIPDAPISESLFDPVQLKEHRGIN